MLSKNTGRDSYNYLYSIGGDLFINHPKNKSSRRSLQSFPSFISDKSTKVYFDMPEVYGPEYDSSFISQLINLELIVWINHLFLSLNFLELSIQIIYYHPLKVN